MNALPGRRPLRPRLNPALRRVWRDTATLQVGVDPTRALLVDGVDPATARLLADLDGVRSETEVLADATAVGLDAGTVTELLAGLHRGGALLDGADPTPGVRRSRAVVVYGAGPVGVPVAALLGAAGVGAVSVVAGGVVDRADCAPGGLTPADVRRPVRSAARDAIRRAATHVDTTPLRPTVVADLAVIATGSPVDPDVRAALHAAKVPHLVAGVRESTAVIGPLVIPGRTSCLRCADLHRSDRDPSWPLVAAQLVSRDPRHRPPADVALALTAAGLACLQALDFLDGGTPVSTGGSLELARPDWRMRRRSWPPHPACGCTEPPAAYPAGRIQVAAPHQTQWR